MSHQRLVLTPVAAAAACVLSFSMAHAQTAGVPESASPTLATVTVNASADASAEGLSKPYAGGQLARGSRVGILGNQDMMETPFNGTSYTSELIQNQQARNIGDVLQNDPSVRLSRGFGNYQQLYVVRGFPLYSDDIAYNGLYGLVPRQYMLTEFIERVDVLRGANSFVNGAAPGGSGVGGSINLVPKRASSEAISQITLGTGSSGQNFVSTDIGRRFGPDQRTGIRINAISGAGGTGVDREKSATSGLSIGLDWHSATVRLSADLGYQNRRLEQARPSVTVAAGLPIPAAPNASANYAQPWTFSSAKDTFGTVRGEFDLTPQLTAWAAIGLRNGNESNVLTDPLSLTASNGATTQFRFDNVRQDQVTAGEVGIRGKFQTGSVKHTVSASVSSFDQQSRNAFQFSNSFASNIYTPLIVAAPAYSAFSTSGGSLANPLTTLRTKSASVALADTLAFAADTVFLTLGLRSQKLEQYDYNYTTGLQTANANYSNSRVTPALGLVFKLTPQVSLYGNRVQGLTQGLQAPFGASNVGQRLDPSVATQQEVGVKYDAGTIGGAVSVFSSTQPNGFINPATSVFSVAGVQRNQGAEFTAYGQPVKGVRVLGGLTLLSAKQINTPGGVNNGRDAIGVPRQQLNFGVEWDVPGVRGLVLTGRAVQTGAQYADAGNTQQLPSWMRMDLGARYSTEMGGKLVTFRARLDNASNKSYWASAGGYPGQGYLVLGAPRTFALSASLDF